MVCNQPGPGRARWGPPDLIRSQSLIFWGHLTK
jgi:hypothetical protein